MGIKIMGPRIERSTDRQGIGVSRLTCSQFQLGGLLVGNFSNSMLLDLNLLVAHLGGHQILLVIRHGRKNLFEEIEFFLTL
jgi:hypothetical protein